MIQTELFELVIVELIGVVPNDNLGNSKSTNNVLPYKISSVPFYDFGERLSLYPLGEVIYGDNQKFPLQRSLR